MKGPGCERSLSDATALVHRVPTDMGTAMHAHDVDQPASKSKKKRQPWDWFPCYPDNWLRDTKKMSDTQARVYWDFICISCLRDDGIMREADKWTAYELRCSIQKWRTVKAFLIGCGLLVETPCGGLANPKVLVVCRERQQRSKIRADSADARHQNPRLPFGINEGGHANAHTHARASFTSITGIEERKEESPPTSPPSSQPMLPSDVVAALVDLSGIEKSERLIRDYQKKPAKGGGSLADNAKHIRNAFIGWLYSVHQIDLRHMQTQKGTVGHFLSPQEIIRQCALDPDINPLAKRARR